MSLSEIFAQLSEVFKEPTREFADDVASGRLSRFFKEQFAALSLDPSLIERLSMDGDIYSRLDGEYRWLFLGPQPPYIVPVESAYKRWTNDPGCQLPIASQKGYLMGDPAIDMLKRYQAEGMVTPDALSSMPDHIALELEYMSFLLVNRDDEAQREFLVNHLDWIGELARDIVNSDHGGFYSTCAEMARIVIERFAFGGVPARSGSRPH
jgi:TorA maturation chaperone TorD